MDCRVEITRAIDRRVQLPLSKSLVARALIINALMDEQCKVESGGCDGWCDDIDIMASCLKHGDGHVDVGAAGTAMRFLTAYFACRPGSAVTLDGSERMRQRPIGVLVDALRQMGASIEYVGNEGYPPLKIAGCQLHGGNIVMRGDVSSQYASAVLMVSPLAGGITLTLEGDIVSRPYIDMTLAMMRHHGIEAHFASPTTIVVPAGHYVPSAIIIEGDWSAASYWLALKALLPESRLVLSPLAQDSLQGDCAIVEMMKPLGVECEFAGDASVVLHRASLDSALMQGAYERDMAATPDLVPTLVVTLCLLRVPFRLAGVATLRLKESDRLEALRVELAKLGYRLEVDDNTLSYDGSHVPVTGEVALCPHDDHRLAMALSLAATRHKIVVTSAEVVSKSYPQWWQQLLIF